MEFVSVFENIDGLFVSLFTSLMTSLSICADVSLEQFMALSPPRYGFASVSKATIPDDHSCHNGLPWHGQVCCLLDVISCTCSGHIERMSSSAASACQSGNAIHGVFFTHEMALALFDLHGVAQCS